MTLSSGNDKRLGIVADIKHILRSKKHVKKGDQVVNVASMPIAEQGMANMIKLSAVLAGLLRFRRRACSRSLTLSNDGRTGMG